MIKVSDSITLPCGAVIKNRIGKSAMSEGMAARGFVSGESLNKLYERWAMGGTGLLITGNIMINHKALGEPRNVVFEKGIVDENLKKWATAGTKNNTHIWTQINHPGKQSPKFLSKQPLAPSAIPLQKPLDKVFATPRALTEEEIYDLIARFAYAAKVSKENGFTGVQIHGAHGYLVSQFLSPNHNQRNDQWGGNAENRMRFVSEVYKAMRAEVGADFPLSIKLNSSDFQKGGFSKEESMAVVQYLSEQGMDLIEISGGTYEKPAMVGTIRANSTRTREAYFMEYCEQVRKYCKAPLMLTGGFRTSQGVNEALASGACDMIGLARPLAINPDFSNELLSGPEAKSNIKQLTTGIKALDKIFPLETLWYAEQLHLMGQGNNPNPARSPLAAVLGMIYKFGKSAVKRVR